ncbi:MAG: hypothetical protein AAFO69_19770 [Bacteroidota bacterium]
MLILLSVCTYGQSADSLKHQIRQLEIKVQDIDLRMNDANKQFKTGVLVSTLGYTVTIAGGLMLGRENDSLGQTLLVIGGATGITGTYLLMDSFNVLAGKRKKRRKKAASLY